MLSAKLTYPEWDYRKATYLRDHCSVIATPASDSEEAPELDDEAKALSVVCGVSLKFCGRDAK